MIQYIDRSTGDIKEEHPPSEGLLRFLYQNPLGRWPLLSIAKRKWVSQWYGRKMSTTASAAEIATFVDKMGIDMSESLRPIKAFETFNDFFYRKLKPSARPIGSGLVSPGDGRLLAFDTAAEVQSFFVKGRAFDLATFVGDASVAERYADGPLLILRLAPNDYHRYHFPYSGIPSEAIDIKGYYLSVSPIALARHFVEVFCQNRRQRIELQTNKRGNLLLMPVGATMVGSMVNTYTPGEQIGKGDEIGYFAFGGSTIVVLLEPDQWTIDQDLLDHTRQGMETYVKMGERIAQ